MEKIKFIFILSVTLFFISGCSKNDDDDDDPTNSEYYLRAKINGELKSADPSHDNRFTHAHLYDFVYLEPRIKPSLLIEGSWVLGDNVNVTGGFHLEIPLYDEVTGIFEIGTGYLNKAIYTPNKASHSTEDFRTDYGNSGTGKIIIEEYNDKFVKGKFEFTAQGNQGGSVVVTEGEFKSPYKKIIKTQSD